MMTNNKFIDYLRKYEELKMDVEYLNKESLELLEQGSFIECRILVEEIVDKQKLIKLIENCEIKWGK